MPEERNCTGVECPVDVTCPSDSLKLPRRHIEGECCGIPGGCECLPAPCPKPDCQPGFKEKVIQPGTNKPGSCCPIYECQPYKKEAVRNTCKHEGKEIADGEKWKRGNCQECVCTKGEIHCTKSVECPPLPKNCHFTAYTESSCCPLCYHDETVKELAPPEGCKSGRGIIFKNDQSWYEDECTKCTCVKGEAKCLAAFCITNTCQNATWEEGDCCPRCNGDSLVITPLHCPQDIRCNMKCKNGFVKDDSNCFICKCKEDECKLQCPNGFLKDENGIEICECVDVKTTECPSLSNCHKKCKYGYKLNKQGCPICKCDHACKSVDHSCKKNCPHGLQIDHKGCLICKCRGSPYNSETNTSLQVEQECNTDVDIWRDDGEAWNDGCRQCYCHKGKEMCALIACPKLDCPDPVVTKKSCCPTCPGNDTRLATQVVCYGPDGLLKLEGESWSVGCVNCICHGGRVMCNREVCPPAPCSHPLPPQPGECCPTCTEDMQPVVTSLQGCGDDRPAGSTWREGNCVSCICANGIASCFTETCHQVDINCKTPLQVKNLCCSICLDGSLHDEATCLVGNVTFNLGDQWEADKCKRCTCDQGRTVTCIQTMCETSCSNSNENSCCPKCKDSEGITDFLYMFLLCAVMCLCGAGMVFAGRLCCLRRHQLKICQPHPPAYPYKYVPTFEGPTTQTSPLTLKSPV
ncbi:hypothetical protein O3M35_005207 [Rhynocoris fuscipes]|uniref:Cysteine-rich motor neuron 1 protein n=1 Tax=Rhynocoris fuscipes TaxID=488301 RepID=A0AAW1DL39_9HEMI